MLPVKRVQNVGFRDTFTGESRSVIRKLLSQLLDPDGEIFQSGMVKPGLDRRIR